MRVVRGENKSSDVLEEDLRSVFEADGYHCAIYTYPPGTVFPDHSHTVDKVDAVLSGRFRITIGTESVVLTPGDYLYVPAGVIHRAKVIGDEAVVSMDAAKPACSR